jgi:enoyl-CoA hydratase/carnithine racemase
MAYEFVTYEKRGHTAIVTINRPEVMNALHYPANEELYDVWTDFDGDPEMWTAVLTGAGSRAFCAGSDIKYMAQLTPQGRVSNAVREARDSRIQEAGMVHREIWKPIIAAVNGYALGGGLEVALACDFIIASEKALFGTPEVRNSGGYPGSGGVHRLPRQIPPRIALYMMVTGDLFTAEEVLRLGLINKVVPAERLMDEALALAEKINERPPVAVRVIKEIMTRSLDLPLEYPDNQGMVAWDLEDRVGYKLRESEDWRSGEGPRAFVEKRKPVWKGR